MKKGCRGRICRFYNTRIEACNFALITGTSRTKLHLGEGVDINNPCREFEKREEEEKCLKK